MTLEHTIQKATCRVDKDGNQLGSAFWVSDNELVTAAHVVDSFSDDSASIQTADGESIKCTVEYSDSDTEEHSGTDLALLKVEEEPEEYETLPIDQNIPSIGTEVVWSGYARLFGESKIDRQRFGWGRVASVEYGENNAELFEVDGLFNPSHSGGPVVSKETEQVVGVVSASAGGFDNLEDAWARRSELLTDVFDLYEKSQEESQAGFYTTVETPDPEQGARIQNLFDQAGLSYEVETENGNMKITFQTEEMVAQSGVILTQMSELLLDTARSTFQMGVGIATGGEPLGDLV